MPGNVLEKGQSVGRYVIESVLGEGGMGVVYRATDVMLRREVALKVVVLKDAEAMARFLREARAAAALQHPNIVSVYDVGEEDGRAYLALELIEGRALRDLIGDPAASFATRLGWLVELAKALAAAHARGFIHRDVKPDNVLIAPDGRAKLLDFGIAKKVEDGPASFRTRTGDIFGTPDYMAPEQWATADVDARADQFAWGLTAYEVLSRRALPERERPPPLQTVAPDVPDAVVRCITKAFAHGADERHADMNAIVALLEPYVAAPARVTATADVKALAPRPKTVATKRAPPRSSRALVFALALAVTCAIGAVAFAIRATWKSESPSSGPATTVDASSVDAENETESPSAPVAVVDPPPSASSAEPEVSASHGTAPPAPPPIPTPEVTYTATIPWCHDDGGPNVIVGVAQRSHFFDHKLPALAQCFRNRFTKGTPDPSTAIHLRYDVIEGVIKNVRIASPQNDDAAVCAADVIKNVQIAATTCAYGTAQLDLFSNCTCTEVTAGKKGKPYCTITCKRGKP